MHRRAFVGLALLGLSRVWAKVGGQAVESRLGIDERIRHDTERAQLTMQFNGQTAAAAQEWQRRFKAQLECLLGPYRPPANWETVLERTVEFPDHIREERLLTAPGLDPVPVYRLRPRAPAAGRRAGIVAIHGHGLGYDSIVGRDETPELKAELARFRYDYGLELVRRGFIVAAPCLTPFGRRLGRDGAAAARRDACETTQLRLQLLGRNLMAENLRDILWTLDFLAADAAVDPDRLGCVGLSLGGRMTMLAAALDPRIKVAVMAGSLNCLQERVLKRSIGGCQVIPGLLRYGDTPEITALIAPRPILNIVGEHDSLIDPAWAEQALERIRRVYRALGAESEVRTDRFGGGHQWHGDVAYPLLQRVLGS